jgi:hypothetical protein
MFNLEQTFQMDALKCHVTGDYAQGVKTHAGKGKTAVMNLYCHVSILIIYDCQSLMVLTL